MRHLCSLIAAVALLAGGTLLLVRLIYSDEISIKLLALVVVLAGIVCLLASLVAGSKEPGAYVISKDAFSKPEPYGIMLRKDDPAFKKVVDGATAALYTSGEGLKLDIKGHDGDLRVAFSLAPR